MAINVGGLVPASTKAKNVATEEYVDTEVSGNILENISSNNDDFAIRMGYANYADMTADYINGNTVIEGGFINAGMIQAQAITAQHINTDNLVAESIKGDTILGNDIVGATITGAIIRGSFMDLSATSYLTFWQYYTVSNPPPSAYHANYAKNDAGQIITDADGYYRLVTLLPLHVAPKSLYEHGWNYTTADGTYGVSLMDTYTYDYQQVLGKKVIDSGFPVGILEADQELFFAGHSASGDEYQICYIKSTFTVLGHTITYESRVQRNHSNDISDDIDDWNSGTSDGYGPRRGIYTYMDIDGSRVFSYVFTNYSNQAQTAFEKKHIIDRGGLQIEVHVTASAWGGAHAFSLPWGSYHGKGGIQWSTSVGTGSGIRIRLLKNNTPSTGTFKPGYSGAFATSTNYIKRNGHDYSAAYMRGSQPQLQLNG